jgi:hypothetical protein
MDFTGPCLIKFLQSPSNSSILEWQQKYAREVLLHFGRSSQASEEQILAVNGLFYCDAFVGNRKASFSCLYETTPFSILTCELVASGPKAAIDAEQRLLAAASDWDFCNLIILPDRQGTLLGHEFFLYLFFKRILFDHNYASVGLNKLCKIDWEVLLSTVRTAISEESVCKLVTYAITDNRELINKYDEILSDIISQSNQLTDIGISMSQWLALRN